MSYNARIRKRKLKIGESFTLSIVRNWRDKSKGMRPNHRALANIGTVKDYMITNPIEQTKLWAKIDFEINKLFKVGQITETDKTKIEKRFLEFLPRPVSIPIVPIKPKPTISSLREKYPIL